MADKYDEAIAYLTENPEDIYDAWMLWARSDQTTDVKRAHCLFQVARVDPDDGSSLGCGCLTQIRSGLTLGGVRCGVLGKSGRQHKRLTTAVRSDKRLPSEPGSIRVEHLPVFAEWQRRLDKELGRT